MITHYLLPSLNSIIGYEQLAFLKSIMVDQWELVLCALDYYAKGQDIMYEAYWKSYNMVLMAELEDPEGYMLAKRIYDNLPANRASVDMIYQYIRNTLCMMLQQLGINSQQFNNIAGISHGDNYFRVEIMDGIIQ